MRFLLAAVAAIAATCSAAAAPPSSCASKFVGEWQHNGNGGNRGTLTRDGRAICTENAFCQAEGTWTCAGNTMTYTTSMGSYIYTLMPDGSITANGGLARATRIGRAPPQNGPSVPSTPLTAARSTPDAGQNPNQPRGVKDCSGVSGKINGVELKPMKCDDPPGKAAVPPPSPKPQSAKASTPASGTLSGSQRALDAVADISPEFKSALENAAVSLSRPNVDPSRFPVHSKESEPGPPASRTQLPSAAAKSEENSPEEAIFSPDSDSDDYAKKCRDKSFGSGLKSLVQDIKAARKGPKRDAKFYAGKVKLVNKVLKKCISNVLDREIIEPLKQSGIFEELAGDAP